jgi:hypothetical protein
MPKKAVQQIEKSEYTAFSDFELLGKQFNAGDPFTPPFNYQVDNEYTAFRAVERKGKQPKGIAFVYAGETVNKEQQYHRIILPIE